MTVMRQTSICEERLFTVKDPMSALTHFIGMVGAIVGMPILLIRAGMYMVSFPMMVACAIFMMSMIVLYGASTAYHSFSVNGKVNRVLKKIDHCSIFLLIAGSYTPVAIGTLTGKESWILLAAVWITAIVGILFKLYWVTCPKWVSSVIYTMMGWICVFFMKDIVSSLTMQGFLWLLIGGLFYTVGAVIYACKWKVVSFQGFGNHELFHCFVLAGSLCHFLFVYSCLIGM